jgi:hypothetical protein
VRESAGAALERITGRSLGHDEDAWRRWWREHGDDFLASAEAAGR